MGSITKITRWLRKWVSKENKWYRIIGMRQKTENESYLCKIKKQSIFFQNGNRHVLLLHTWFLLFISRGFSLELLKMTGSVKTKVHLCFAWGLVSSQLRIISHCQPVFHDLCVGSEMQAHYFGDGKWNETLGILFLWITDFVLFYTEWLTENVIFFC